MVSYLFLHHSQLGLHLFLRTKLAKERILGWFLKVADFLRWTVIALEVIVDHKALIIGLDSTISCPLGHQIVS